MVGNSMLRTTVADATDAANMQAIANARACITASRSLHSESDEAQMGHIDGGTSRQQVGRYSIRFKNMTLGELYVHALSSRDEKAEVDKHLTFYRQAVKTSIAWDRMMYVINTSASLAHAAEKGLSPAFHRRIRPLKTKKKELRVLVKDVSGKHTGTREEQGTAFKVFLARRAHGTLKSFA